MNATKNQLRQIIRERKKFYDAQELRAMSDALCKKIKQHPRIQAAKVLLLYYSLPDEVDTHDLIQDLVAAGKTVLLPIVEADFRLSLRRFDGKQFLKRNEYAILEPVGEDYLNYDCVDVAIVPGMGFDRYGHRLGRGKGYYDRLLPLLCNAYLLGLCFPFQKLECIPVEEHDVLMNEII